MGNSYKPIVLIIFLFAMSFIGIRSVSGTQKQDRNGVSVNLDTSKIVSSVNQIHDIVENEVLIDTTQFGVCDTCRTSFSAVLDDNRKLCDTLFSENMILYERIHSTKRLNDSLAKVEIDISNQIRKRQRQGEIVKVQRKKIPE